MNALRSGTTDSTSVPTHFIPVAAYAKIPSYNLQTLLPKTEKIRSHFFGSKILPFLAGSGKGKIEGGFQYLFAKDVFDRLKSFVILFLFSLVFSFNQKTTSLQNNCLNFFSLKYSLVCSTF